MKIRLGEVIEEYSVRNKDNQDIPVYSVTNTQGFCTDYFSKEIASKDKATYKIVPRGYFAYNPSRINVGSVDWQHFEDQVIVSPLYVVFGVSSRIDPRYLLHYLKSDITLTYIKTYATGSVRDNLKISVLKEFPIDLRTIEEQRHIASVLDRIDDLIGKNKSKIEKLDELVKSRFIEMFGSPILNDKGFPTICGKDYFKLSNGKAVPEDRRMASGIPAYGGNGVSWYTDESLCSIDTLVVGRVGFQSGNVHLAKGPLWITDNAMYISDFYVKDYNLVFLYALMEQIDFTKYQDAGDLKKITQKPFMKMVFIDPPRELQKQYAAFVVQTDKSKLAVQKSLRDLELLKKSKMQEYFS